MCCINEHDAASEWTATDPVNLAVALSDGINGNTHCDDYQQRRLLSFMLSHIGTDYPDPETKKEYTTLRVWVNGSLWINYYLKLSCHSSFLKTSSPSGYGYKDKIGFGREVRIQGNGNKDVVLCLFEDPRCSGNDGAAPMVNGVGFWNLTKGAEPGEIRNIIQLNNERALDVAFKFLIRNPSNVGSIRVELVSTKKNLKMNNEVLSLWSYPSTNPMMDQQEGIEVTDSSDSTASLSPVASRGSNNFQTTTLMGDTGIPLSVPMASSTEHTMSFAEFQPFDHCVMPNHVPSPLSIQSPSIGVNGPGAFQQASVSLNESNPPNLWNHNIDGNGISMLHPVPIANSQATRPLPIPLTFPLIPSDSLNSTSMQRQNTNSLPPLPLPLSLSVPAPMDTMSIAPSNQMGRDSCSVAPFACNQWIEPDMQSLVGGYGGVHRGSYDFTHSDPLHGIGRPNAPFNV
jgi:hypothetical protein